MALPAPHALQDGAVQLGGSTYQGLFRFVPRLLTASTNSMVWRHGPTGGHDRSPDHRRFPEWLRVERPGTFTNFDVLDLYEAMVHAFHKWWDRHAVSMQWYSCGWLLTLWVLAMVELCWMLAFASPKPQAMRSKGGIGKAKVNMWQAVLFMLVLPCATAGPSAPTRYRPPAMQMPTDLQIWAAGQTTMAEQMAEATRRHVLQQPLHRSPAEAEVPRWTVPAGEIPVEGAQPTMDDHQLHVTMWVAAPYYEAEVIDALVPLPLRRDNIVEAIRGSTSVIPDEFDQIQVTVPQLDEHYASFIAFPQWLNGSGRSMVVIDCRRVGGTAYVVYVEAPLNAASIASHVTEVDPATCAFFLFGDEEPLRAGQAVLPVNGGVIKVMPIGVACQWASEFEPRLRHPARWLPNTDPPGALTGLFSVFQSSEDQVIQPIQEDDQRPLEEVAEEALITVDCMAYLPEERLEKLSHCGRSIWEQVAVLDSTDMPRAESYVIFLDLRPIGIFPQWAQMVAPYFSPREYVESLQLQGAEGWILAVRGGEPAGRDVIKISHREVLTFTLQQPGTSSEEPESADDEDQAEDDPSTDDSSSGASFNSGSSDGPPVDPNGPPRGPPPPRPIYRSRSPRREPHRERGANDNIVRLADHVPPPTIELDCERVPVQPPLDEIAAAFKIWPDDWLHFNVTDLVIKPATLMALTGLLHWTSSLIEPLPEVHIYTDGSYSEANATSGAAALIMLGHGDQFSIFGGVGTRILGDEASVWEGAKAPALLAEQVAITLALLWIGQAVHFLAFSKATIHFDCQPAGWGADGSWAPCNEYAEKLRGLESYVRFLTGNRLEFAYVRAHNGEAWNECADVMAKLAATGSDLVPKAPVDNCKAFLQTDYSWTATAAGAMQTQVFPIKQGRFLEWSPSDRATSHRLRPEQLVPTVATVSTSESAVLETTALTVNLQGLRGKHAYVEQQMVWKQINIAFVQETKDADGTVNTKNYLRLSSPSESHWGTAVWLNKQIGAFRLNGSPVTVEEADVETVFSGPRLLLLCIRKAGQTFILFSGHCPHGAREAERKHYLQQFQALFRKLPQADFVLGGMDANARPPENFAQVTGGRSYGQPDLAGQEFATTMHELGLWLPSTFCDIHDGPDATYQHPCGQEHRIDFLLVGGEAAVLEAGTHVAADFDTANKLEDHKALEIRCSVQTGPTMGVRKLYRPQFDRQKMRSPEGKAIIKQAMEQYPQPDWATDIDKHCQHFQDYLIEVLETNFKKPHGGAQASYITEEVWGWRATKLRLKEKAGHRRRMWPTAAKAALQCWKGDWSMWAPEAVKKQEILYDLVAAAISFATARIKRQIYEAKQKFLQGLAKDGVTGVGQMLHKLRQNGVGGRRNRLTRQPLPKLKHMDGRLACSRPQRDMVWLNYFGEQEYGSVVSTKDFLEEALQIEPLPCDFEWGTQDVPTPIEVEKTLRQVPLGKAPGLDNLPGEALRAAPPQMAAALHPLFVKALLQLRQPLQWRGGILFASWKGAGHKDEPASHRSLFVSSTVGKSYHKLMRGRGQEALQGVLHDLHLGSKRNAPIGFASLYLLGFLRGSRKQKSSYGALFIDTKAAYYRVVRQVAMGSLEMDENVAKLLAHFGLGPDDMHHLLEIVKAGGLMREADNRPSVQAACADFHRKTWFVSSFTDGRKMATTATGSRPGESWADAIFSYVYARAMGHLVERADGESLLSYIGHNVADGVFSGHATAAASIARDGTWADDTVLPIEDLSANRLVRKAKRLCALAITTLEEFGLSPNLKPGKTTMILCLQGKGAQVARQAASVQGRAAIYLEDMRLEVPVASHYIHLGGAIDAKLTLHCEVRRRLALLGSAYDQGKKLLFQNVTIPLETRAQLFEVAVRSTLFNLDLWVPQGEAWKRLAGGYSRCLRRLLATSFKGELLFKLPLPMVHVLTNSWSLELVGIRSRLGMLAAMVQNGPEILWAVLQREQMWLQQVRKDMQLLVDFDPSWPRVARECWPAWVARIRESPGRFKQHVRKMLRARHLAELEQSRDLVALWMMYRMASTGVASGEKQPTNWSCRQCRKMFRSKGGLGAHLFKAHGRTAAYRPCVKGTVCLACGVQFWTQARLAVHLRDTWRCTDQLRRQGQLGQDIQPGFGSTALRRKTEEQFTLAPTERIQAPAFAEAERCWSKEATDVYREVCETLFDKQVWETAQSVHDAIVQIFTKAPLYANEEVDVCDRICGEIELLKQQDSSSLWDDASNDNVLTALGTAFHRPEFEDDAVHDLAPATLQEFADTVATFDWNAVLQGITPDSETPEPTSGILDIGWDEGKPVYSDVGDEPTAVRDPLLFIPLQLRTVWSSVLLGTVAAVRAPGSFWDHPISAPFVALRGPASN